MLEFLLADDVTPAEDQAIPAFTVGGTSTPVELHAWNSRGVPGGQALENVLLLQQTEDPVTPGEWLDSGIPPQDELWSEVRVIGSTNDGDASYVAALTDWTPLGAYAGLLLGQIPPDCAVHLEWRSVVPGSASSVPYRFRLTDLTGATSRPLPALVGQLSRGVVPFARHGGHSEVLRGCAVTASSPVDEFVNVAAGQWQHRGRVWGIDSALLELDQDDGAAEALTSGQHYLARLVLEAGVLTLVKGLRGAAPAAPTLLAYGAQAALVRVEYQPGGISQISAANILAGPAYGRYQLLPGVGLQVLLGPGEAVAGASWRYNTALTPVNLTNNATNWIWQGANGGMLVAVDEVPPAAPALLLWEVVTSGGAVVSSRDLRTFGQPQKVLRFAGPLAVGVLGQVVVAEAMDWERSALHVFDRSAATAGSTTVTVEVNAASRLLLAPEVAWDEATDLAGVHDDGRLHPGDVVRVEIDGLPDGSGGVAVLEMGGF